MKPPTGLSEVCSRSVGSVIIRRSSHSINAYRPLPPPHERLFSFLSETAVGSSVAMALPSRARGHGFDPCRGSHILIGTECKERSCTAHWVHVKQPHDIGFPLSLHFCHVCASEDRLRESFLRNSHLSRLRSLSIRASSQAKAAPGAFRRFEEQETEQQPCLGPSATKKFATKERGWCQGREEGPIVSARKSAGTCCREASSSCLWRPSSAAVSLSLRCFSHSTAAPACSVTVSFARRRNFWLGPTRYRAA